MSNYAILRFSKRKAGGVASADRHNERKKAIYKSNPNIDPERTKLNYHLIDPGGTYKNRYEGLVTEAGCKVRSNSVVMVETLITASPDFMNAMSGEEQRKFFENALEFIGSRVGKQNIISAVVHMDETTPHMHLSFCPITENGKLSAKDILGNRQSLSKWQDDFYAFMSERYQGLSRGIPSYVTHRKHIPSYLFAQAAELDKVYPQIVETMKDINAFNSGKKRNASLALLSQYAGKIQRFTAHLHETEEYVKELEKVRDELTKETDLQGEKLKNLELDFVAQRDQVNTLLSQMNRMQEVLDSLPPEVLEKAIHKEKER